MADLDDVAGFEFEPRMSDADALMWSIEKDPLLRSTITTVMLFDRAPDRERFEKRMERLSRVVPRLRQRVMGHPMSIAPPRWVVDPNFDLRYHLRWQRAIGEGTMREVFDIAQPIAMQGFDRARPLWEFTMVEGLADGRAALIAKIHHSITDGVGGMKLQMELLDLERDPANPPELHDMPAAPEPEVLSERQRWIDAMVYETQRQGGAARSTAGSALDTLRRLTSDPVGVGVDALRTASSLGRLLRPTTEPMSPLMRDRSLSVHFETLRLPLRDMKAASKVVSGKLNDAFVAGVTGGFRRYHQHHGHDDVGMLRMAMPINVRTDATATKAGNQFVPTRFPVPIDLDDPIARMNSVRELVAKERAEPALALSDPLANLVNRLPATATTSLFGSMLRGVDFITSNVPGAPIPVFLCGAQLESQIALGPMSGAAANVVLVSYCDDLNIGVNTDPAAIPDPEVFLGFLEDSFGEILKLA
jgi:WS/DGAT/MGAT family acyltransferase